MPEVFVIETRPFIDATFRLLELQLKLLKTGSVAHYVVKEIKSSALSTLYGLKKSLDHAALQALEDIEKSSDQALSKLHTLNKHLSAASTCVDNAEDKEIISSVVKTIDTNMRTTIPKQLSDREREALVGVDQMIGPLQERVKSLIEQFSSLP